MGQPANHDALYGVRHGNRNDEGTFYCTVEEIVPESCKALLRHTHDTTLGFTKVRNRHCQGTTHESFKILAKALAYAWVKVLLTHLDKHA